MSTHFSPISSSTLSGRFSRGGLGPSKFMKRLPGEKALSHAPAAKPFRLWDPNVLDRLSMPLSRIRD